MKITNIIKEAISNTMRMITCSDSSIKDIKAVMMIDNANTQFFNSIFHLYFEGKENSIQIEELTNELNKCFSELDDKQKFIYKLGELQSYVKLQNKYYETMEYKEFSKMVLNDDKYKIILIYLGKEKKEEHTKIYAYLKQNYQKSEQEIDFILLHMQKLMIVDVYNYKQKNYYYLTKTGFSLYNTLERNSNYPVSNYMGIKVKWKVTDNSIFHFMNYKGIRVIMDTVLQPLEEKELNKDFLFTASCLDKEKYDNEFKRKYRADHW